MKFTSATTLLACFLPGASADQSAIDKLVDIKLARDALANVSNLAAVGDSWEEQLACVADLSGQPSIVDSAACPTTEDSTGQACVWCEGISSVLGTGLCVSSSQKNMIGQQYFDMLCGASSGVNPDLNSARNTDNNKLEVNDSFLETTTSSKAEEADQSAIDKLLDTSKLARDELADVSNSAVGDSWEDQLACTVADLSSQPTIVDSAGCATTEDSTGQACVWCEGISSFLGTGVCVTSSQKDMIGQQYFDMLCSQREEGTKKNLRGAETKVYDWNQLDLAVSTK